MSSSRRQRPSFALAPTAALPPPQNGNPSLPSLTSLGHLTRALLSLPARLISPGGHLTPADAADSDSLFLTLSPTTTVHYKRYAPARTDDETLPDEILIAAHGFGANLSSYSDAFPLLVSRRPRSVALAFDSPGFGLTSRPPLRQLRRYRPEFSGRIIGELWKNEARGPARPVYMGFSLGARAVAHAALAAKLRGCERPSALVLVCPAIVPRAAGAEMGAVRRGVVWSVMVFGLMFKYFLVFLSVLFNPVLQLLLRVTVGGGVGFWVRGLSMAFGDPGRLSARNVAAYRKPLQVRGWALGILHFCRAMMLDRGVMMDNLAEGMRTECADVPILVVHGSKDRIIPLSNSQALIRALPQAQLVVAKGLGHMPQEENPEEFVEIVDRFLSSLSHYTCKDALPCDDTSH